MTKGPRRHEETWWWTEEVAEAVREKKIKYGKSKKENVKEAWKEYKKSRQNAKRVISSAKEWANDLNDSECQNEIFRMAKQMVRERQDITGLNCIKGAFLFNFLTISYVRDSYRDIDSYVTILPSLPT